MQRQPDVYIYLDKNGIESLFAQTADRVEVEIRTSTEKATNKKAGAKFGLGKAIAALLGIEAGTEVEASKASKQLEEAKLALTVEHKLSRTQQYLSESNNLITSLGTAIDKSSQNNTSIFINIREEFDLPQFIKGQGVMEANEDGAIMFEIPEGLGLAKKVVMAASLSKFPRADNGRLGSLSHEAIHFKGCSGREVLLHVFGYIRSLGNGVFQIKPYAIWL